jgi:predicted nucleotidyltransferase
VHPIAERFAPLLASLEAGASAIWLAGSHATGDPGPHSDVDLGVISSDGRRGFRFEAHAGTLVSISTISEAATREPFNIPRLAGAAVPGWREAVLLFDPHGIGRRLNDEARAWTWDAIAAEGDAWAAEQLAIAADQVLKLLNALHRGEPAEAALRRNDLAATLPQIMAVRRRLLYGSDRRLFGAVNDAVGEAWARRHSVAMAVP